MEEEFLTRLINADDTDDDTNWLDDDADTDVDEDEEADGEDTPATEEEE